jgi:hypothetical protein
MFRFTGSCHCGTLTVTFESTRPAAAVPVRECGCTFCRRHGARAATDPAGRLIVAAPDPAAVSRYVFGLRTAEFLVCRTCGVFVAAVMSEGERTWATLNVNALDERAAFAQPPVPVDYDRETVEERVARRKRLWTPAEIRFGPAAA